jgi:hypothetical protein
MSQIINYDNQEFDLNSLFTFGFEPLKYLISTIAKGQKDSLKRIENIENKVSLREKKIEELDKQLKKQENFMAMKFKTLANSMTTNISNSNRQDAGSNNADNEENVNIIVNTNQQTSQQTNQYQTETVSNFENNKDNSLGNNNEIIFLNKIKIGTEDGNRKLLVNFSFFPIL